MKRLLVFLAINGCILLSDIVALIHGGYFLDSNPLVPVNDTVLTYFWISALLAVVFAFCILRSEVLSSVAYREESNRAGIPLVARTGYLLTGLLFCAQLFFLWQYCKMVW